MDVLEKELRSARSRNEAAVKSLADTHAGIAYAKQHNLKATEGTLRMRVPRLEVAARESAAIVDELEKALAGGSQQDLLATPVKGGVKR